MTTPDARFEHGRMLDRSLRRSDPVLWSETCSGGMVVTAHYLATRAGVGVLEAGGNAMDAAVAASLALSVCEPAGSGLGGMAMMLWFDASRAHLGAIAGPCRAPALATPTAVAGRDRYRGYTAVAVPTHVAVLRRALARHGSLPESVVAAPAIALAEDGFPLTPFGSGVVADNVDFLQGPPRRLYLDDRDQPRPAGSQLRQPALAWTLRRLAESGFEDFHRGEIARRIAADMEANGGFVRLADLGAAAEIPETAPLEGHFAGDTVATMGPPGGGLALLQMLGLLDQAEALPGEDPAWSVVVAQVIRRARTDRRRFRLRTGAEEVGEGALLLDIGPRAEGAGETSHLCTMDARGNAVSMTQSLERSFGAGIASADLGFLYNGYLRGFKVKNKRHPHYLTPGAPARSNAAPTIVMRDGHPRVVIGSTGAERMASSILQVLERLRRQRPFEASHAPRLHCTPEGELLLENERFPPAVRAALEAAHLSLTPLEPYSFKMGGLQLIVHDEGCLTGVSEPRRDGAAAGPRRKHRAGDVT